MCSFISFPYIRDGGMTSFLATTLPAALHDTTIEGHPTLDVSPMSQCLMWCIYPHLNPAYVRQDASPSYRGSDSTNMLDVVDFASFYETLPTAGEWNKDGCRRAVERVKAWSENHNALSYRYPVASTLRDLADMCGRLSKRVNNDWTTRDRGRR